MRPRNRSQQKAVLPIAKKVAPTALGCRSTNAAIASVAPALGAPATCVVANVTSASIAGIPTAPVMPSATRQTKPNIATSILTEADDLEHLREAVRDAVRCHFGEADRPKPIRLHLVHDEVIAA